MIIDVLPIPLPIDVVRIIRNYWMHVIDLYFFNNNDNYLTYHYDTSFDLLKNKRKANAIFNWFETISEITWKDFLTSNKIIMDTRRNVMTSQLYDVLYIFTDHPSSLFNHIILIQHIGRLSIHEIGVLMVYNNINKRKYPSHMWVLVKEWLPMKMRIDRIRGIGKRMILRIGSYFLNDIDINMHRPLYVPHLIFTNLIELRKAYKTTYSVSYSTVYKNLNDVIDVLL